MIRTFKNTNALNRIGVIIRFTCAQVHSIEICRILADRGNCQIAHKIIHQLPVCRRSSDVCSFPKASINTTYPNGLVRCIGRVNHYRPHPSGGNTAICAGITIGWSNYIGIWSAFYPG